MIANVYVDGFSLYYGSLKDTAYRWLDIGKLCNEMDPELSIKRIRYFTAKVDPRKDDPGIQDRQKAILRALRTIPNLSIVYGMYRSHYVRLPSLILMGLVNDFGGSWYTYLTCGMGTELLLYGYKSKWNENYPLKCPIQNSYDSSILSL